MDRRDAEKSGRRWELVIVGPPAVPAESFSLGEELSVVARRLSVVLTDDTSSPRCTRASSCGATKKTPTWRTLGSTNGTLLNGETVVEPVRSPGDRVQFGCRRSWSS